MRAGLDAIDDLARLMAFGPDRTRTPRSWSAA